MRSPGSCKIQIVLGALLLSLGTEHLSAATKLSLSKTEDVCLARTQHVTSILSLLLETIIVMEIRTVGTCVQ